MNDNEDFRKTDKAVRKNIKKNGWDIESVPEFRDFQDGMPYYEPPYCYSTGLTLLNLPELILFGFESKMAARIINAIGLDMKKGLELKFNTNYDEYLIDYPIKFIEVCESAKISEMPTTARFYKKFRAYQIVWPDKKGVYPDQPGFDHKYFPMHPLLDKEPDDPDFRKFPQA